MALLPDQKFSTFADGGTPTTGDIVVGLRSGINTKFNWVLPSTVDTITGTANQVLVNGSSGVPVSGNATLSTPQDINTTSSPTFNALTLTNPLTVPSGGTGLASLAVYRLLAGGTTTTGVIQQVVSGSAGQLLQSNGASALPTWTSATFPVGPGTLNHLLRSDGTNWVQSTATTLDASDVLSGLTAVNVGNIGISGSTFTSSAGDTFQFGSSVDLFNPVTGTWQFAVDNTDALLVIASFENGEGSSNFFLLNSRSPTVGGHGALLNADSIGGYSFLADDGTNYVGVADITVYVNGTVSLGVVPTKMVLSVTNAAGAVISPLTLNPTGNITSPYNIVANNFLAGFNPVTTSASPITLLSTSKYELYLTGTLAQTVVMPDTSTLIAGHSYLVVNNSSNTVTVNSSGGNLITSMAPNTQAIFTCILNSGTTAASWYSYYSFETAGVTSITGTADQVIASASTGAVTLSLPQSIATTSSPTFAALTLTAPLTGANGGTGVNNGTSTFTIGGNTSFSGAFTFAGTLTGATAVTFPTSGTLATTSQLLIWAANASSSISAAVGNGYILTSGSPTTVTLPTTFAVGSRISVAGQGAAWTVAIGASTNIKYAGNTYTTSMASLNNSDTLELIATVANTTWAVLSMPGTGLTAS